MTPQSDISALLKSVSPESLSLLSDSEQEEFLTLLEEERTARARESYIESIKTIDVPGAPLDESDDDCEEFYRERVTPADHHELLIEKLEAVERGEMPRLMVLMPPGTAKTTYANVCFVPWVMGRRRRRNIIAVSYAAPLAKKFGRRSRQIVRSPEYREIFGAGLSESNSAVDDWSLDNESTYMSGGILSGVTGNRADGLLIDDPIKGREDADSKTIRDKTWEEYLSSLRSRLKPRAWIVMILTRWHEDDPAGRILPEGYRGESGWITARDGERWYVLCLQAQCEREDDPLGRDAGEYLWTEWFPVEHWEAEKRAQGSRNWSSLYQQRPSPEEGSILKRHWWRDWSGDDGRAAIKGSSPDKPPHVVAKIQVWDTAFEDGEDNDYSACTTWGVFYDDKKAPNLIMLSAWKDKLEYPDLRKRAAELHKKHKPDILLIEKKASGHSLIQDLRRAFPATVAFQPKGDKVSRAHTVSALLEAGRVWFASNRSWAHEVIDECAVFPNGAHDDYVDTVVMALDRFAKGGWVAHPDDERRRREANKEKRIRSARPVYGPGVAV